jgi:Tfp pilus assembly protein FimT
MTLLELILVMMVLFVLAAVVAPRFSDSFPALQVRKTADHLLAWARKARSDAATTGLRQRLVIDSQKRKFWIEVEADPFKNPGKFVLVRGAWDEETLAEEIVFESLEGFERDGQKASLEFRPDGTSEDATLVVANERGDRRTIKVVGASSRVAIAPVAEGP